ncbi:MAG: dihydropteroate synthase [Campylobacterales bacterium]|nr:dihydropteroate synthase [Campylobacterales bacterium]
MTCCVLAPSTDVGALLQTMEVTMEGVKILEKKGMMNLIYLRDLRTPGANILKQDALSVGADLAVPRGTICCETHTVDALLMATDAQLKALARKARVQPFGLKALSSFLHSLDNANKENPSVMGVVNLNADSFFRGSRCEKDTALARIETMIAQGARYIDIGGVSSRPGSEAVSEEEEMARIQPVVDAVYARKLHEKAVFSLDSYTPKCLEYALSHGFGLINDITGLANDAVAKLAGEYGASVCIMHMQGDPKTMQHNPYYEDVMGEVDAFFEQRIEKATAFGVEKIILDVGIGFGKTLEHNLLLLKHQRHFLRFGYPLLVGASRKSLINTLSPSSAEERLGGTLALHLEAVRNGASIVRCHDVFEHVQALRVMEALEKTLVQGKHTC